MLARLGISLLATGAGALLVIGLHRWRVPRSRRLDVVERLRNGGGL